MFDYGHFISWWKWQKCCGHRKESGEDSAKVLAQMYRENRKKMWCWKGMSSLTLQTRCKSKSGLSGPNEHFDWKDIRHMQQILQSKEKSWTFLAKIHMSGEERNGKLRVCADFSTWLSVAVNLHKCLFQDVFATVAGASYFNQIDLTDSYLQIKVRWRLQGSTDHKYMSRMCW